MDPVTLGLCSQIDLDLEVQRAAKEKPIAAEDQGPTLLPAAATTVPEPEPEPQHEREREREQKKKDELDVETVFAKLKQLGGKSGDKGEDSDEP